MQMGDACKLSPDQARSLHEISQRLGRQRTPINSPVGFIAGMDEARLRAERRKIDLRNQKLISAVQSRPEYGKGDAIAGLVQMLQADVPQVRRQLIDTLSQNAGPRSSSALAMRAVFDLDRSNRTAATMALQHRPASEYRGVLLAAFNYPWVPAAQHAAEALVLLKDRGAIEPLIDALDNRNPHWPRIQADGQYVVRELVKVNHLRNCLLCHAPSTESADLVRGRIPYPDEPLPRAYYHSLQGSFVRADITYLRQDFSLTQPVANHGDWPELQRHDYLVRQRPVSPPEAKQVASHLRQSKNPYRDAMLFALRRLTNKDVGDTTAAWQELATHEAATLIRTNPPRPVAGVPRT